MQVTESEARSPGQTRLWAGACSALPPLPAYRHRGNALFSRTIAGKLGFCRLCPLADLAPWADFPQKRRTEDGY
jgi:hypothetical protein